MTEEDEGPPPDRYGAAAPFRAADPDPLLQRALPVAAELPRYRGGTARRDLVAGVTVAALAIPSAMAYAEVAGVDAINGLYALLLPPVAYALLGSSRQLIVGPEGSLAALIAASIVGMTGGRADLAAMLALLVAAFFVLGRLARIGWVADYLSRPVLVGYIHGVAIVLVIGQLGKLLGLSIDASGPLPQLVEVVRKLGGIDWPTVAVGFAALALLLGMRRYLRQLPASLIVVVAAIAASELLDLADHGVAVVGALPSGLPRIELPSVSLSDALTLIPAAAGLFLLSFADEVLTARSFAGRHDQRIRVGSELLAMGAANAAAGLTQGFPVGASGSRTAVNDEMGARSQIAGIVSAVAVALVLLFLTAPIAHLPKAVLGAVIVNAALGLVEPQAWRALARTDRVELAIAAVAAAGVVTAGVLNAILFAVGLSIVDVVRRSARPHDAVLGWSPTAGRWADVAVHRDARVTPGVVVYRLDDRLFFANAGYVKARVREALHAAPSPPRALVIDAEGVAHVDAAGLDALADLQRLDVELYLARIKAPVAARLEDVIAPERRFPTVRAAVTAAAAGSSPSVAR
ncbi:MAG TPA: SulP family inorganic anion transporter [Solirubrobacter sp.]|nr:SulP family inorganic anion transporter [Solirubrobacter sp.]